MTSGDYSNGAAKVIDKKQNTKTKRAFFVRFNAIIAPKSKIIAYLCTQKPTGR